IAPVISIAASNIKSSSSTNITFKITELNTAAFQNIQIEYFNGSTTQNTSLPMVNGPITQKSFSTPVTAPSTGNTSLSFKVTYTDLAGNTATQTINFKSDNNRPTATLLSINNGATEAVNNNVQIETKGTDATSKVTAFCLKYNNSTEPSENDSCWRDVNAPSPGITPSTSIHFSGYYYQIGFVKAYYT